MSTCEVPVIIQHCQVVEELQRLHQGLWGLQVHEVEVDQVIDPEFLQLDHRSPEVRPQDLRVCVVLHLILVSLLCV